MLTKYILHINGKEYELRDDDLKNWDEILCSYKRASYDGVVRSFSSQFEFTNRAYELLQDAFLEDRFNTQASIEVQTINDSWIYETQFSCPLDFSTIEWESHYLRLNAVDNSLAAILKANKSTKYELGIGSHIAIDRNMLLTRIPMQESLVYGFTQGESAEDSEDIRVAFVTDELPWLGNKGSEVAINQTIDWLDDQETEKTSYLLRATKNVTLHFKYAYEYRANQSRGGVVRFMLRVRRNGIALPINTLGCDCGYASPLSDNTNHNFGVFDSRDELPDISDYIWSDNTHTIDWRNNGYAIVKGVVHACKYDMLSSTWSWENTGQSVDEYFVKKMSGGVDLNLMPGDIVYLEDAIDSASTSSIVFSSSEFSFEWMSTGEPVNIGVVKPETLCRMLLRRITEGSNINVHVHISDFDSRMANTYLMAAEGIRSIPGAKFYSSFSEFSDWMSAVFGYVYYIGETQPAKYCISRKFGKITTSAVPTSGTYTGVIDIKKIQYNSSKKCFFYVDNQNYVYWTGWENYNNPSTGIARTDTIFFETDTNTPKAYVFGELDSSGQLPPIEYDVTEDRVGLDEQTIYFLHRSELLRSDAERVRFGQCTGLTFSIDSGALYSSVTAGYEKKDYESVNGRDEFNFNNTYSTGYNLSDKSLSLISKYRADSYGIEFAIQKRSKDTTDTTSDKDIFFVLCKEEKGVLVADRTMPIKNCISDAVFNGAFSPMACVLANAGYIGILSDDMTLTFASSTGNSDVVIDGLAMNGNLRLNTPVATCGIVEFTTDEVEMLNRENDLIEVESDGIIYRGYLKEVDLRYARAEAAKYKLIIREIEAI